MAVPPSFGDLGKAAKDLFDKEFDYPKVKVTLKTKTESGVEFETNGAHDMERSRTNGNLKMKLKYPSQGITLTESWSSNSELEGEMAYEPSSIEGLKLTLNSTFLPSSGGKSARLRCGYKREYVNVEGDVDVLMTGPMLKGSTVFMYKGWYAGYQVGYNTTNAKLTANNLALGYTGNDFTVHSSVVDVADCAASVHHKINDKTEVGLSTAYNINTSNVALGMVGKYTLEDGATVKAKVNNQGQIGVGYTQNLRSGVKLSLSALIEGKNINAGGHKLGAALTFES